MLNKLVDADGDHPESSNKGVIKGRAVVMKKNMLDLNDVNASTSDEIDELSGKKISFQLVSVINTDPSDDGKGKVGKPSYLENWQGKDSGLTPGDLVFEISFNWDEEIGLPGAVIVRNEHHSQFYLKTFTLDDVPDQHGTIHFDCKSWVYPSYRYKKDRIFFTNQAYLTYQTPVPLRKYREEELEILRGTGEGMRKEWDRVYDYAYYNDLGNPDKGPLFARPVLGGSKEYPYPRRGRTGRPPSKTDPKTESRLPLERSLEVYVPRDERFGYIKLSDFLGYALKSWAQDFMAGLFLLPNEYTSIQDVLNLYEGGINIPDGFDKIWKNIPFEFWKAFTQNDGQLLKFPTPQVIKEDKEAWRTDEEFARQMLAGVHPVTICRLQEFPPKSKLDPLKYGNQDSVITYTHIEKNLSGLTVDEALEKKRLFIIDHHDSVMVFLRKINLTPSKGYATRTVLFLLEDGTLKPLAIELSLPHPDGDQAGAISKVFTPIQYGVEGSIWQLAKAYTITNDQCFHQLYSHWTRSHVVMEPIVIASNRQLSAVHPIYKLLHPHFKDTMFINSMARQSLFNSEGILEISLLQGRYAMLYASWMYRDWTFTEEALPKDLVRRGIALENSEYPFGYQLLIEDYPFAVDGLDYWFAIRQWVEDYCSFYYKLDDMLADDTELQSWWKDVREKGHGDKKDEKWWPEMTTLDTLVQTCTTIIWVGSCLHSAVNFGQYAYGGYHPNRPTVSRRFMPEFGTPEYEELVEDPDQVFLRTVSSITQTLLGDSMIELLSRHATDEVYIGQRDSNWTTDVVPLEAFERFSKKIEEIGEKITARNADDRLKNRYGPAKVPYTLLYPRSEVGLTGMGVANSTSI